MKKHDPNAEIDTQLAGIEKSLASAGMLFEKHAQKLLIGLFAILLLVGGFYAYKHFYLGPKEQQAQKDLWQPIIYFERDSFQLALQGDGTFTGFLEVIENARGTKTKSIASYYAGLCYLRLGEPQTAISFLKNYEGNDRLIAAGAYGLMGDAYSDLEDYSNAKKFYKKAAEHDHNGLNTPFFYAKYALVLEHEQQYSEAAKVYEKILMDFPTSKEGREAQKYIARYNSLTEQSKK